MQSKKGSIIEAVTNTGVGFVISLAATFVVLPTVGVESSGSQNIMITLFYTAISIVRTYIIRRFFNNKQSKQ